MNKELDNLWPGPRAAELTLSFEVNEVSPEILTSRICEGGKYEIGFGNTFYEDGTPVRPGETITLERAYALKAMALRRNWLPVRDALKFIPTQSQVDAFAVAAYNLGGKAVADAHLVEMANTNRWEDAAAAFSNLIGATSPGPSDREIAKGWIPKGMKWGRFPNDKGEMVNRWIGPDGQPCNYFRRMRGLLRRRHAEACLFLGYDWTEATKDDAIALRTEREWNASRGRWEDRVVEKTEFTSIYAVARRYPLANVPIAQEPDPPKPAPTVPVKAEPLPEIKTAPPIPIPEPPLPKPVEKPVSAPKPQPTLPNDFDPNAGVKSMVYSRRFWGWLLIILGRISFVEDGGKNYIADVTNSVAADPLLLDAYTGFAVMIAGEAVRWWGEKKATKVLK